MRRYTGVTAAALALLSLFLAPRSGRAQPEVPLCPDVEVVASFAAPAEFSDPDVRFHGLAFDGRRLWAACYGCGQVFKLRFDTFGNPKVVDSIATPSSNPTGVTFVGRSLFAGDDLTLEITRFKARGKNKGRITRVFDAPGAPDEDCVGLTHAKGKLYNSDFVWSTEGGRVHRLKKRGDLIKSFFFPAWDCPEGLAFDGEFLWLAEMCENRVYRLTLKELDPTCYFEGPGDAPIGLTFDGDHLWLSDFNTERLYKIRLGGR